MPVRPEIAPAVLTSQFEELISTVLELPPIVTAAFVLPVPILVAKLEEAFKLTAAPVTVKPSWPVTRPEKVGLFATATVTVSVAPPVVVILVPAAIVMVSPEAID